MIILQGLRPVIDDKAPRCEAEGCEVRPRMRFIGLGSYRCGWCGAVRDGCEDETTTKQEAGQ